MRWRLLCWHRHRRERGIGDLQFYNGAMHRAVFAMPNFVRELVE
jgi:spermidine synthase